MLRLLLKQQPTLKMGMNYSKLDQTLFVFKLCKQNSVNVAGGSDVRQQSLQINYYMLQNASLNDSNPC